MSPSVCKLRWGPLDGAEVPPNGDKCTETVAVGLVIGGEAGEPYWQPGPCNPGSGPYVIYSRWSDGYYYPRPEPLCV